MTTILNIINNNISDKNVHNNENNIIIIQDILNNIIQNLNLVHLVTILLIMNIIQCLLYQNV